MTKALFHSVADKLAEMETEKPGDTSADVKVEITLSALRDTRPKVEAETLAYTLSDVKPEAIVAFLADRVERRGTARDIYQQTGQYKGQDTTRNSTIRNIEAKALVRGWQER